MALVKIVHPELGPESASEVDESSLYQWHQSGWQRADVPGQPQAPAPPVITAAAKPAQTASKE